MKKAISKAKDEPPAASTKEILKFLINYYFIQKSFFNYCPAKLEKNRKLQIIQAAVKRFTKHGLNKTTLDEIARDLRIGKATIYNYFKSKEELFYASIELRVDEYLSEAKSIFNDNEKSIEERLSGFIDLKKNIDQKYPIIYELILSVLKGESFDNEIKLMEKLFLEEKELITNFLDQNGKKNETENISDFLITLGWGFFFSQKMDRAKSKKNNIKVEAIINNLLKS